MKHLLNLHNYIMKHFEVIGIIFLFTSFIGGAIYNYHHLGVNLF